MRDCKWTPGPWYVVNGIDVFTDTGATNSSGITADQDDGWLVADCGSGFTFVDGEECHMTFTESEANAHLIAAAPELYALLSEARTTLEMWKDVAPAVSLCADIDKALAKARGE